MIRQVLLILSIFSTVFCHDTEGRAFRVVFPRNFELSSTNSTLSISLINRNDTKNAKVHVSYYSNFLSTSRLNQTIYTVDAKGFLDVSFPHFDAWEYMNAGWQEQWDTRIVITSDTDISVIAQNIHSDGHGDMFLVLPQSMAGTAYSLTLPAPSTPQSGAFQYTVFYIIPTYADVALTLTVNGKDEQHTAKFKSGTKLSYFAMPKLFNQKPPTIFVTGNQPFLIVAAVTCMETTMKTCDYAAFMPTPLPNLDCNHEGANGDIHPTDTFSTKTFTFTPVARNCSSAHVGVYNDGGATSTDADGSLYNVPNNFGDRVVFRSGQSYLQPIRLGGLSNKNGAFLSTVPAKSQFISGSSNFLTRAGNDTLYVMGDALAILSMFLDGVQVKFSPEVVNIDGSNLHFTRLTVPDAGLHTLSSNRGKFCFYVVGSLRPNHLYGYYPAFNKQILTIPTN